MKTEIVVFGDGAWGTTIAVLLSEKGYDVTLWGAFPDYISELKKERVNHKFLPGVKIPDEISLTSDIDLVKEDVLSVIAIPTKYLRDTIVKFRGRITGKVVSLTKGIEPDTFKRPSEIIGDVLGVKEIAAISGPSISFEVARGMPTTVVAASENSEYFKEIQEVFTTSTFRIYTSNDLIGVELGGALKNIIAIAAGISDGMGFGVNTKAAILTRGLVEIIRLGIKLGAQKETFFGLSGLGDLATTCMSFHSRNRWLGEQIGRGKKLKSVLRETEMVIEGETTTKSAYELARKVGVEMPITQRIYETLYKNKAPGDAVKELMARTPKAEEI